MNRKIISVVSILLLISLISLANALPDYFDWRNKSGQNWMTPVKYQGETCGSCWAFSAIGVVEAQYNIAKNNSNYDLNLSEEYLVSDCFNGVPFSNCRGGWNYQALGYIKNYGVTNETCFSYNDYNCIGNNDACSSTTCTFNTSNQCSDYTCSNRCGNWNNELSYIDDYFEILNNITKIKTMLYENGPLTSNIRWGGSYWDGNILRCNTDTPVDHAIITAGYNDTGNLTTSYWIVKNSWGPDWGPDGNGYLKVGFNECGIQTIVYGVNLTLCTCTSWTSGSCGSGGCLASEKPYTRTCTPSGCDDESKCEYDASCGGGGEDITVCASGCDYTSIQIAIDNSGPSDKVYVKDSKTYEEEIVMNSTTTEWLVCENNSKISKSAYRGIFLNNVDAPVVVGCVIDSFDIGIYINSSHVLIQNNTFTNNDEAIYSWKGSSDNKIKNNNITRSSVYGVHFYANSWSSSAISDKIENNIIKDNSDTEVYMTFGQNNLVRNNNVSGGSSYGVYVEGYGNNIDCSIYDNIIYNNNNGIYLNRADYSSINSNIFCSSNANTDIDIGTSIGVSGDNNRCEKPGSWNDNGTTGCTYYCDNPAETILLYPPNNFIDYDGGVEVVCQSTDDIKLVNITLYHNITGTWQANQTKEITGNFNITTFSLTNLNDTNFIWNCLSYDNYSRGGFAVSNWSLKIIALPVDPYKFYHRSSSGQIVVWLGNLGNIVLKGKCFSGGSCDAPGDGSLIFRNSVLEYVAFINSSGDLCVESGDCSDKSANCNSPGDGSFIVRNSTFGYVSYINKSGDLCLIGKLYENVEL